MQTLVVETKRTNLDKVLSPETLQGFKNSVACKHANKEGAKIDKKTSTGNSKVVSGKKNEKNNSTAVVQREQTSTQGTHEIFMKEKTEVKDTKKKTPRFHLMTKVRLPPQIKADLTRIFDQLVTFPFKKLTALFMENGVADIVESGTLTKMEAAIKRK